MVKITLKFFFFLWQDKEPKCLLLNFDCVTLQATSNMKNSGKGYNWLKEEVLKSRVFISCSVNLINQPDRQPGPRQVVTGGRKHSGTLSCIFQISSGFIGLLLLKIFVKGKSMSLRPAEKPKNRNDSDFRIKIVIIKPQSFILQCL